MGRRLFIIALIAAAALLAAVPALAGGWAVVTLDEWPGAVAAGEPVQLGFSVRQHGWKLTPGLSPVISARHTANGDKLTANAGPGREAGYYMAELTFPSPGRWEWSIDAFGAVQPMPALEVQGTIPVESSPQGWVFSPALLAGVLGLLLAAVSLLALLRQRARWALALVVLGLVAGGAVFASAASQSRSSTEQGQVGGAAQAELGEALFIAKGCLTCHSHPATNHIGLIHTEIGPDLAAFSASPEYLRSWLADPQAIKPQTEMPNLGLDAEEIEALIEFINLE